MAIKLYYTIIHYMLMIRILNNNINEIRTKLRIYNTDIIQNNIIQCRKVKILTSHNKVQTIQLINNLQRPFNAIKIENMINNWTYVHN